MKPDLTLIETERLWLTGWRADQFGDLLRLHGNPEISRYLTDTGRPWTEAECRDRVAEYVETFRTHRMGKLRLIRKSDGIFIGRAGFGLFPPDDTPEIGYALLTEYHGQGYATEAAAALRDWVFRETDLDHFIGFADKRNKSSLAVLERIGMRKTHVEVVDGISGQFYIYERPVA